MYFCIGGGGLKDPLQFPFALIVLVTTVSENERDRNKCVTRRRGSGKCSGNRRKFTSLMLLSVSPVKLLSSLPVLLSPRQEVREEFKPGTHSTNTLDCRPLWATLWAPGLLSSHSAEYTLPYSRDTWGEHVAHSCLPPPTFSPSPHLYSRGPAPPVLGVYQSCVPYSAV